MFVEVYPVTAAHRGLLHAFAFLNPSGGGTAVVRGMYAVGIVNYGGTILKSSIALVVVVGQFGNATQPVGLCTVVHAGRAYSQVGGDCFRIVTMSQHQYAGYLDPVGFKFLTVLKPTKGFEFFYG